MQGAKWMTGNADSKLERLRRHLVEVVALIAVLFVLQTGLVPFDLDFSGTSASGFFTARLGRLAFVDIVSNIFLYIPCGGLGLWVLRRRGFSWAGSFAFSVLACACLSGFIEALQAFSPSRMSSRIDLVSNTVGGAIGAALAGIAATMLPSVLDEAIVGLREHPHVTLVKAYVLLILVAGMMPLSFSLDVGLLKRSLQSANFVPFAETVHHNVWERFGEDGSHPLASDYASWRRARRWSRWSLETASFALLAWLVLAMLRIDYGFGPRGARVLVWWICMMVAVGLSLLQIPILSRSMDVTDLLFRVLGVSVGVVARRRYVERVQRERMERLPGAPQPDDRQAGSPRLGKWLAGTSAAYILYTSLIPMRYSLDPGAMVAELTAPTALPFFGSFATRFDLMIADVMEKMFAYGVLTIGLHLWWRGRAAQGEPVVTSRVFRYVLALSVSLELVQLLMPVRVVSLTDPLLALSASLSATLAWPHVMAFVRFAMQSSPMRPALAPARASHRLSPTDWLISTLADEKPDAPKERVPGKKRRSAGAP